MTLRRIIQTGPNFRNKPQFFREAAAAEPGLIIVKYTSPDTGLGNGALATFTYDSLVVGAIADDALVPDPAATVNLDFGLHHATSGTHIVGNESWMSGALVVSGLGPPETMQFCCWNTYYQVGTGGGEAEESILALPVCYLLGRPGDSVWWAMFQVVMTGELVPDAIYFAIIHVCAED